MPDPASTRSPRPDDSLSSPAWALSPTTGLSPDIHDAVTANTPATGGDSDLADYGSGIGRSIGRFKLLKRLGSGGNGQVYAALHTELGKTVALKFFKAYAAAPPQLDAMRREAQTLASLRHPGIVSVDDFAVYEVPRADAGTNPGSPPVQIPFIVMEYIPTELTLGQWVRSQSPAIPDILRVGAEMCDAVDHAHQRGIIHRDLKPGNVLIDAGPDSRPHPRVIDFGLSQLLAGWGSSPGRGEFDRVTGTLQYMSPEQLAGNPMLVDHRSDVYALGVVLYELLCGRLPYTGSVKLTGELTHEIRHGAPVRPSTIRPELKGPIEDMLLRALEKDPARRHQSAGDLADDLRRILADKPLAWRSERVAERAGRAARSLTSRSRVLIAIGAALLSTYAAAALWTWGGWAPLSALYERLAIAVGGPAVASLDHVRVIEIRDGLDPEALARDKGVEGVHADDPRSLRRLHGLLMQRLALAAPKVVVFDLHFPQASPHDDAFAQGVDALHKANRDVVIGVKVIQRAAPLQGAPGGAAGASTPVIADSIKASGVRWGYIQFDGLNKDRPLSVPLATRRGAEPEMPSLSMRAIAAATWPRTGAQFESREDSSQGTLFAPTKSTIILRCYEGLTDGAQDGNLVGYGQFPVSSFDNWSENASIGFSKDDEAAMWTIELPPRAAFEPAVRDYADVLRDSDDALRAWVQGKIVLIGDARSGVDRGDFSTYTDAPYAYAHAAAMESLSKGISIRYPSWQSITWVALVGALTGAALGFALHGRPRAQFTAGIAAALLLTAGAIFLYAGAGIVANPFVTVAALVIAMALTAGFARLASSGVVAVHNGSVA